MKYYAQFYRLSNGQFIEPCGSFAIIRLDGRQSLFNMKRVASRECTSRHYDGFRIGRGNRIESLLWLTAEVQTPDTRQIKGA